MTIYSKGEDAFIEANYEVIRFIEHGSRCRPAMDCVPGELLIYRLKKCPEVEKRVLFEWMRQLLGQLELYHRWRGSQCYRYVNPFSVLVTRDDKILLLDLEAESNEFVLRNMQKRAMRNHFVKPIIHIRENTKISLDLYGFGKTIQFILANTEVEPSLTKLEEFRLEKIIEKCLGENPKKQYEDLAQVKRDLPSVPVRRQKQKKKGPLFILAAILILAAVVFSAFEIRGKYGVESRNPNQQLQSIEKDEIVQEDVEDEIQEQDGAQEEKESQKYYINGEDDESQTEETTGPADGLDELSEEAYALENYLLRNTAKDNRTVIEQGESLRRDLTRYLAAAYDREEMTDEALSAYETLCEIEVQEELLKAAYIRRIELAMQRQDEELAVQAGQEAVERFPELRESEVYQKLAAYRKSEEEYESEAAENVGQDEEPEITP